MKLIFILAASAAMATTVWAADQKSGTRNVSAAEAQRLIAEQKPVILDVRSPEEFKEGHLPGALNVNVQAPDFEARLKGLDRDKPYLVYCRSGNRSRTAARAMQKLGFQKVYELSGGIKGWIAAKYPLER
jgi:rhodanese-related sulfurtransferase